MPGNYSKLVTVITGQTITAAERNNEFDNVINNMTPDGVDDASANVAAMQATTDPYPLSVVSAPTSLRGEIQRLRHQLKVLSGQANWYEIPAQTLTGPTINIMDYIPATERAAVIDGTTTYDATTVITTALAALPATGGTVYFPPGTYLITSNILIRRSNTRLLGSGMGASIIKIKTIWSTSPTPSTTVAAMLCLIHASNTNGNEGVEINNILIRDLTFYGIKAPATGSEPKAISCAYANNVTIESCRIENFGHEAIWPAGGGIAMSTKWRITNNYFYDIGLDSVPTAPSAVTCNFNDAIVAGNTFEKVLAAVGAAGSRSVVIGNQMRDVRNLGIGIGGDGTGNDAIVVGNVISMTGNSTYETTGILLTADCNAVICEGNTIRCTAVSGALAVKAIYVTGAKNGTSIIGNSILLDAGTTGSTQCVGINYGTGGSPATDPDLLIANNVVRLVNPNSAVNLGIGGDATVGQTHRIRALGNVCQGFIRTTTTYAYDLRSSTGSLILMAKNNITDGGYQRYVNTLLGATKYDDVPIDSYNRGPVAVAQLEGSATLNFGVPGAVPGSVDLTIAVTGAALGDPVTVAAPVAVGANYLLTAFVSAADTVTVRWTQIAGAAADPDGGGGTYKVMVWQH